MSILLILVDQVGTKQGTQVLAILSIQIKGFPYTKKKQPSSKTKDVLINHKLKENKCEICGITEWNGKPITFQLHHKNGNPKDDRLENLQILCPNCHSQTDTFCKRQQIRNSTNKSAQGETPDVEQP